MMAGCLGPADSSLRPAVQQLEHHVQEQSNWRTVLPFWQLAPMQCVQGYLLSAEAIA